MRPQFNAYGFYFDHAFSQQSQSRRGKSKNRWIHTLPQKDPIKIKAGPRMYEWLDVAFLSEPDKGNITISVQRISVQQTFNLNMLMDNISLHGSLKALMANPEEATPKKILFIVWEYLINTGQFPYPVEILN